MVNFFPFSTQHSTTQHYESYPGGMKDPGECASFMFACSMTQVCDILEYLKSFIVLGFVF